MGKMLTQILIVVVLATYGSEMAVRGSSRGGYTTLSSSPPTVYCFTVLTFHFIFIHSTVHAFHRRDVVSPNQYRCCKPSITIF